MSSLTATELRKNIYNVLDEVLRSGVAQEIVRKGKKLLLIPAEPEPRRDLSALPRRQISTVPFDELAETRWDWDGDA